ncbi:O-acetyl-ADP-ribose deacetylase [Anatilimnocola aggregata]|uniref:O-acetyl-ADP-ribose deacetylase n=1 Tax=Anatilimnocola aggregata TaxID=2528021 RepID=A0A517YIB9_9BACT|nr:macro domain-containing protein [Anatilimnocola aggregata]QDU29966.1 O-acetyl-ADP-ribose deacetylase [Anatilimnocola aggregata]
MTKWQIIHGDLLDVAADGLLCSANPSLNLSGGVGGAFSLRYGPSMQTLLHEYLRDRGLRNVPTGTAVVMPGCGSPFRAVAQAVAIDVFYGTSSEVILQTYSAATLALAAAGCRSIAAACLGCGYGRCPAEEFLKSVRALIANPIDNVDDMTLATTNESLADSLRHLISAC